MHEEFYVFEGQAFHFTYYATLLPLFSYLHPHSPLLRDLI